MINSEHKIMEYKKEISSDGTIKLTFDEGYNAVIIPTKDNKYSLCLSSQIGCPVNCEFCHTGKFERNLSKEEIIQQYLVAKQIVPTITSIVFMGMGEPTLNLDAVESAIEYFNTKEGIGFKKITLSTVGINLEKLKNKKYLIAISLHASNNEKRKEIIPNSINIEEIVDFTKTYQEEKNGIMISYTLIKNQNDTEKDLQNILSYDWPKNINFNLLELNLKKGFKKSDNLFYFKEKIREKGFKCFIRESRGQDIKAACGMLSHE